MVRSIDHRSMESAMLRTLILLVAIGLSGCIVEPYRHHDHGGYGHGYGHDYGGGYGGYHGDGRGPY